MTAPVITARGVSKRFVTHTQRATSLEERLRTTQAELAALRQSYAQLLAQLYPPIEVSVVARAR